MPELSRRRLLGLAAGGLAGLVGCSGSREDQGPAKLVARDGDLADRFGRVALAGDGTTALVGAPRDEDAPGAGAGSVYAFSRAGDGEWRQTARFSPVDADGGRFGAALALADDGATALVGAPPAVDPDDQPAGGAYVYSRTGAGWRRAAALPPGDDAAGGRFGARVALAGDGTTALVGAPGNGPRQRAERHTPAPGAAHVFAREDGWRRRAVLPGDGAGAFGTAVALSADGSTAVCTAPGGDAPDGREAGVARVFAREDGWRRRGELPAPGANPGDGFGESVVLSGDGTTALVGAPRETDVDGTRGGAVYCFVRRNRSWTRTAALVTGDADRVDRFGARVALAGDGSTAVVGAPLDERPAGREAGSAYLFVREGEWREAGTLTPVGGDSGDRFGLAVDVSAGGEAAVVGAPYDEHPNGAGAGSAYAFDLDP